MIVETPDAVTLVGGGDLGTDDLSVALTAAPVLVAADGGADAVLAAGLRPVAVIGDMDSLSAPARAAFGGLLHRVAEQETTDFDKALRAIRAPVVVAVGFAGGRIDHLLAVLHSLILHRDRPCLVLGPADLIFHCPPDLRLDLAPGCPLSLFPMAEVTVDSDGLEWPTAGLRLAPGRVIGTSNRVTGPVRLWPSAPGLMVTVPRAALAQAVAALVTRRE
jgi:thiamine pyrophosphokinase